MLEAALLELLMRRTDPHRADLIVERSPELGRHRGGPDLSGGTTMYDLVLSWVRTAVPAAVGSVIAWLATKGYNLDAEQATGLILAVGGVCVTLYQVIVSTLQRKWPVIGVLLGSTKVPVYKDGTSQAVHGDRPLHGL